MADGEEDTRTLARGERPGGPVTAQVLPGPRVGARATWVEIPAPGQQPVAWCYTDCRSYLPGRFVTFFLSTTVRSLRLRISRDDAQREPVATLGPLAGQFLAAPDRAYEVGCDWPAAASSQVPDAARPGPYLVELLNEEDWGVIGHHLFFIRNADKDRATPGRLLLVAATSTWAAYNDWGGANHYFGLNPGNFLLGDGTDESLAVHSRGSGMIVSFRMGEGEVFTAATCEWVNGLIQGDFYTETITRNVLNRFSNRVQ